MRSARANRDAAAWRDEARALLASGIPPSDVAWLEAGATGLLFDSAPPAASSASTARVPARFLATADDVVLHREPGAHALLYRVLWRITHGEPLLLDDAADGDVRDLDMRARQVRRSIHDTHAFVRFRQVDGEHFAAWYDPHHHVLERAAPFFVERFATRGGDDGARRVRPIEHDPVKAAAAAEFRVYYDRAREHPTYLRMRAIHEARRERRI